MTVEREVAGRGWKRKKKRLGTLRDVKEKKHQGSQKRLKLNRDDWNEKLQQLGEKKVKGLN